MSFYDIVGANALAQAAIPARALAPSASPTVSPASLSAVSRLRPASVAPLRQAAAPAVAAGAFYAFGSIDGVTGRKRGGSGFSSMRLGVGRYRIQFRAITNPDLFTILFGSRASVTGAMPFVSGMTFTYFDVDVRDQGGNLRDGTFDFAMIQG